jgi:hypothetical protein
MVRWTNLEVTQSIFLLPRCDSNCYVVFYILELLKRTHSEVIDFNCT